MMSMIGAKKIGIRAGLTGWREQVLAPKVLDELNLWMPDAVDIPVARAWLPSLAGGAWETAL